MEQWNKSSIKIAPDSQTLRILQKSVIASDDFDEDEKTFILILEGYERSYCQNCLKNDLPNFEFKPNLTTISVDSLAEEILNTKGIEELDIICTDMNLQKKATNLLISIIQSKSEIAIYIEACYGIPKIKCLAQNLKARELRAGKRKQLKNIYRLGNIHCAFRIFQDEYEKAILNLTTPKMFSIYNIICFAYLDRFSPPNSPYYDLSLDARGHSLNELVQNLSLQYSPEDIQNADLDLDTNSNPTESHFKNFSVTCRRKLKKFFSYVLDETSYNKLMGKSKSVTLTILDCNFIRYLLSNDAHNNINDFVKQKYTELDDEFRLQLHFGLYRLEHLHGLHICKEKFAELWNTHSK